MNVVHSLLHAFGGSANLTTVLALLGGWTGISMVLMSPIMAFIIKVNWSTQKKNISVWIVCFVWEGVGMYVAHAFTGGLLDVATWIAAWGALSVGATAMHDKIWGTNGTGISTWIEHNFFPGTDVPIPTSVDQILPAAKQIAVELFEQWLKNKGAELLSGSPAVYTGAGTAGAVPNPDPAPLTGGPTIDLSTPVNSSGVAAQAELDATQSNGSTGQSYVNDSSVLPVTSTVSPTITPAPSVAAQVTAVTNAIASGTPVEKVVDNYAPVAG